MVESKAMTTVNGLYENRRQRVNDLKSEGKKIIGYFCCYPPLEIITAAGAVPFRIMGSVKEPITRADAYVETNTCPFVRSCLDLAIKGEYDLLDGLVVPHSCDNVQRIYDIWRFCHEVPYTHFINVPHMVEPSSHDFFRGELGVFKRSLESFTGEDISQRHLAQAIELHNQNRALIRELYNLRKQDPPVLSGTEMIRIAITSMSIPIEESNKLLKNLIREV